MSLTLLLDLDDTLLVNNIDEFLPRYLGAFSREVAAYVDPDQFVKMLLVGTRAMVANRRPDCTLKEVFENAFFPELGLDAGTFRALAERFYMQVFPTLKEYTSPRPEAVHLVAQAQARGYKLVIATNPLFPLTAIQQRLAWAGLPVERYPFDLVTSYETFHFGKPEPAFFAEILARMGWPAGPIVMVGDDLVRDISAARRMGLAAFWLSQDGAQAPDSLEAPSASGSLEDVLPWIDQSAPETLQPDYVTLPAMLSILRATPAALDSLCRDLPGEVGSQRPEVDEWCVNEVLCHMRDVDQEVNLPRLHILLNEENPFIPGMDTDAWAIERNYLQQDGALALQKFIFARMQLLELLESIQPGDWQRMFRHAIFGPTRFSELVNIITAHDRLHIRQIQEIMAALRA